VRAFTSPTASIAGRLLIFSIVFVSAALVVASVILWFAIRTVVREQIDQRLDTQIGAIASATATEGDTLTVGGQLDGPPFDRLGSGWYWQVEANGQRKSSRSLGTGTIDAPPAHQDFRHMLSGASSPNSGSDPDGNRLYIRQAVRSLGGATVTITATAPSRALVDPAGRALLWLIPCMVALGAVLIAGTLWQIRYGLRPLISITDDIDAIKKGELRRVPSQRTVELSPLAIRTNELLAQNEDRLTATRLQFANLAHSLKTPVASLFLALNDNNDPRGELRQLADRIDRRIKHHLSAARRVMGGSSSGSQTAVFAIVADLQTVMAKIHADRQVEFTSSVAADLSVACDAQDVEEMLGNLIENAFKWASTRVTVTSRRDGQLTQIAVDDDGPGIPAERLQAVILPGVREDERVPGDGFGLTIVTELAELYGGSLHLENRKPTGLSAILALPSANGGNIAREK
jgi:signal transduction histidine kinase